MASISDPAPLRKYDGHWLARTRKSPGEQARIAVDILRQKAVLDKPTASQLSAVCRVSPSAISEALNGHRIRRPLNLKLAVQIFQAASPDQRREFVRGAGISEIKAALAAATR